VIEGVLLFAEVVQVVVVGCVRDGRTREGVLVDRLGCRVTEKSPTTR
jgi:hypothetical protein